DVALEDLDTNNGHQRDDQPRRGFADPSANAVNRVQDALDVHPSPPLSVESENNKAPSGRARRMVLCQFQRAVRSASWHSVRNSDRTPSYGSRRCPAPTASPAWRTRAGTR